MESYENLKRLDTAYIAPLLILVMRPNHMKYIKKNILQAEDMYYFPTQDIEVYKPDQASTISTLIVKCFDTCVLYLLSFHCLKEKAHHLEYNKIISTGVY